MRTFANQYGSRQEEYWDEAAIFRTSQILLGAARIPQDFNGVYKFAFPIPTVARENVLQRRPLREMVPATHARSERPPANPTENVRGPRGQTASRPRRTRSSEGSRPRSSPHSLRLLQLINASIVNFLPKLRRQKKNITKLIKKQG